MAISSAEIITIGDELLIGQVINTNQAFIAEKLNLAGISIARMTTVGDDLEAILSAFGSGWQAQDVVIVTGGLGPTHDDITKKAVCRFFKTDLVSNDEVRRHIEALLARRNAHWSPSAEEQTLVPRAAGLVPNPLGTAAGFRFEEHGKLFFVLPGVPYEMKAMVEQSIMPILTRRGSGSVIRHLTLRTTGIAESTLAQELGELDPILQGAKLAFLPSPTGVRLRITLIESDLAAADRRIAGVEQRIRERVEKYIYGTDTDEIEAVLGQTLAKRGMTIAVAESCTGGLITHRLTNVSGSSAYVERGVITYSNRSKIDLLGVPAEMIQQHGAVSGPVAEAMAAGVRKMAGTDVGISTTGIAGPTGGSPEKPVGLVWVAYADGDGSVAIRFNFSGTREVIKERASQAALELVRRKLLRFQ
jgi:nicotinamide-nucleotide amidase